MGIGGPWRIGSVRRASGDRGERVTAEIAGAPLWFESADAPLDPCVEAFASALFQPALRAGARVVADTPLDSVWLAGTARLPALYASWWGWSAEYPVEHPDGTATQSAPASAAAACFTGGVDSFYTLLVGGRRFERLLFVHGYDIALDDHARFAAFDATLREVAAATGTIPLRMRTNLREHPVASSVNWELTHGAALAAAGLVAAPAIGSLTIPSSYRRELLRPWGSHPDTDPAWSTSRVAIVHDDFTLGREAKLAAIVHEPLVARHLRVCYENRTPEANCSACLKCVRTLIAISAHRRIDAFTTFDRSVPVAARIDALRSISEHLLPPWRTMLDLDLEPDVRAALVRLLERSAPVHGVRRWLRAAARRGRRLF
jgi:hypothetical protein